MVSAIDIPCRLSVLNRVRVLSLQRPTYTQTLAKSPPSSPTLPPPAVGGRGVATFEVLISAEPRLRDAYCPHKTATAKADC